MTDSFNLVASEPVFFLIFVVSVGDGVMLFGVGIGVFSWELLFEVDGAGLFS